MANGDGHDPRKLWEQVRDRLLGLEQDNKAYRKMVSDLKKENEELKIALEVLKR